MIPLLMRPNAFENFYLYVGGEALAGRLLTSLGLALVVYNNWNVILVSTFLAFGYMRNMAYWLHVVA